MERDFLTTDNSSTGIDVSGPGLRDTNPGATNMDMLFSGCANLSNVISVRAELLLHPNYPHQPLTHTSNATRYLRFHFVRFSF